MKKFFLMLLVFVNIHLYGQISITNADFGIVGDSIFLSQNNSITGNFSVGATGLQTWNFTNIGNGVLDTIYFSNPQFTSYFSLFNQATEVTGKDNDLTYFFNNPAYRAVDGIVTDLFNNGNVYALNYSPDLTLLNFPSTYLDSFYVSAVIDTSVDTSIVVPPLFNFDSVRLKRVIIHDSKIDAYGQISTPGGTFSSIRQYRIETQIDTLWTHTVGGGWALSPVSPTSSSITHKYIWYTNNKKYQIFEAIANGPGGTITSATFLLGGSMSASILNFQNPNCANICDGWAAVDVVGGTQPYTYQWSSNANGQITDTVTSLCGGLYQVTVYDFFNDSITAQINLTAPQALVIDTNTITPESALGNDGAVDINVTGGNSPYTYLWSNNATTQDISGLTSGTYTVNVTDLNSCTDSMSFFVPSTATKLTGFSSVTKNVTCFNACDGEAKVVAAGGAAPYTYLWSNNVTDTIISMACSGVYSVTIYDANSDSVVLSANIQQPAAILADTTNVTAESPSGNDGAISISVTGGTPPYQFNWSNADTTQNIVGLATGNYSLTVTDANLCTGILTVFVPSSSVSQGITYFSNEFGTPGDVALMAIANSFPLVNISAKGSSTWNLSGLPIDEFDTISFLNPANTVNGTFFNNSNLVIARAADTAYLNISANDLTAVGIVADAFNLGGVSAIKLNPGLKDLQFPITFGQQFTSTTIVDSIVDTTVLVFDSIRVKRILTNISHVDAYGNLSIPSGNYNTIKQRTQIITIDSLWGYNFLGWQNIPQFNTYDTSYQHRWFAKGEIFPVLVVESSDSASDITSVSFKIGNTLLANIASKSNISCNGACDGEATAMGISGAAPYNFYWDAGTGNQTTATATNLCQGTYTVTVVDNNSDSVLTTVDILEPLVLVVTLNNTTTETDPGNNGAIDINVTGGTSPYTYNWSNTSQTTQDVSNLAGGSYTVTVTDANGCTQTLNVTLPSTVGLAEISKNLFTMFPNPAKQLVNLKFTKDGEHLISITDVLGNQVLNQKSLKTQQEINIGEFSPGLYIVSVTHVKSGTNIITKLVVSDH